ncbi:MAG TPA: MFS transporter [Jatrophihabitans sp.]|jgi:EmrB/QacA subfamily drug resistance transporter
MSEPLSGLEAADLISQPRLRRGDPSGRSGANAQDGHWLVFAIVSMALLMSSLDQTIVATALPVLQRDLGASINWTSWTITIYSLGQIIAMPLAGRLSDAYGRKRIFLLATVLFTAASLCCGLASNVDELVALRFPQALGGGAFMPSATGIVSDYFGKDRDRAVGLFASIVPIGAVIGPVVGGVFVTYWSWRAIFFVNVPIGVLLLALGWRYIPNTVRRTVGAVDFVGVGLLGFTLLCGMFGVASLGGGPGLDLWIRFAVAEALAVLSSVLFLRHVMHSRNPFIPGRLLYGKGFGVMNLINFLYGGAALGFGALVPLYGQLRYGIPILAAGGLLVARALGMVSVAGLAVYTLRRTGYRSPMVVGFLISACGLIAMSWTPAGRPSVVWLSISAAITGVGMGASVPAANNATLQLAPDQVAAIAGLRGMFRQSGAITAVSVSAALLARSGHQGTELGHVFLAFAVLLIMSTPLVLLVPQHRGRW